MNKFRGFLLHTGVICSFVCIAAKVLDWYNPYMDFSGHIWFLQLALYFAVILLAFVRKPQNRHDKPVPAACDAPIQPAP